MEPNFRAQEERANADGELRAAAAAARGRNRRLAFVAAGLAFAVFLPVLGMDFHPGDDRVVIQDNPWIRGFSAANARWWMSVPFTGHYEPLSWMLYAAIYHAARLKPAAYHLVSAMLHAANAVLVFGLCLALCPLARGDNSSVPRDRIGLASAVGALVFAVHPLRVECVAWASAAPYPLAVFFALAATLAYCRAARKGDPGIVVMAGLLLCFAASLLSVPLALGLPVVWLLLDWGVLRRGWGRRRVWLEKAPFFALSAIVVVATVVGKSQQGLALKEYLLPVSPAHWTQSVAYGLVYPVMKTMFPQQLSPYTPLPDWMDLWRPGPVAIWFGLLACGGVLFLWRRRMAGTAAAAACAVALLAPTLAPRGSEPAADRYAYAAAIALSIWVAAALLRIRSRKAFPALIAGALVWIAALAFATQRQLAVWKSPEALALRILSVNPHNAVSYDIVGRMELDQGRLDEASRHYQEALQIEENAARHVNLGAILAAAGDLKKAAFHFRRALRLDPANPMARANLEKMGLGEQ